MLEINQITNAPLQNHQIVLEDGSFVDFTIYYRPMQQSWFFNNITHNDFVLNGLRICNLPNLLMPWSNILEFGIACFSEDGRDPALLEDFISGHSRLYILTKQEVTEYLQWVKA